MLTSKQSNTCSVFVVLFLALFSLLPAGCSNPGAVPPKDPAEIDEVEEEAEEAEEEDNTIIARHISPVTAIINNHSAARPQSGLQQATIVYEFLVEGALTRFLAVYNTPFTENFLVGPVRSLRPYLGVQALEHGGAIAHSGYSQRTAALIRDMGLKQITSSNYLFRDSSRRAPHNLYSDIEKLHQAAGTDLSQVEETGIVPQELPAVYEEGREIEITYNSSFNRVTYVYDEGEEVYLRFINDSPHTDRETAEQYSARRVILRETPHRSIPGPEGLVDIELVGEGDGFLFEAGKKYPLRWKKEGWNSATRYYYTDGTPVEMRWGNTWIQVVKP